MYESPWHGPSQFLYMIVVDYVHPLLGGHERRGRSTLVQRSPARRDPHFSIQYSPSAETSFRVAFPSAVSSSRPVYLPRPLMPRTWPVPPVGIYVPTMVDFL